MKISKRVENITESGTLAAAQKARDLKAKGIDVISLTIGESDFNTPEFIQKAAIEAIKNHKGDHYTPVSGIPELRQAIVDFYKKEVDADYKIDEVFVGTGVKNVLYNLFQTLINPGDEVILPAPYWVSFSEQIKLAGGTPVIIKGKNENQFKITTEDLEQAKTEKTKALLINSPSNPSGAVYSQEELDKIGEWAVENDVVIVSDEIYNSLVYNGQEASSFSTSPEEIKKQTIVLNGVSKAYAMTGWRIGFALGDSKVIKAMDKFASHSNGNPTGISQYGAIAAYLDETEEAEKMRETFEKRLDKAYALVEEIPGFKLETKPQGAFYLFPDVTEAAEKTGYDSVDEFSLALLEEAHVATVAGSGFGVPECLRLSYATDEETFAEGMDRIKAFIEDKMN